MAKRLTPEQVEMLRQWGTGLERGGASDDLRAAGRAIRMLVEEVESLDRALWHQRAGVSDTLAGMPAPLDREPEPEPAGAAADGSQRPIAEPSFLGALAERLGMLNPQQR